MPVDKDGFAFRLRQSDDFACSLKWNQNLLYLNSGNRVCLLPSRDKSRRCDEINRGEADVHQRSSSQR